MFHGLHRHTCVYSATACQSCFARAAEFKREHSEVGVHLVVENTRRCCQAVSRGELDFAVVGGKIPVDLQHLLLVSRLHGKCCHLCTHKYKMRAVFVEQAHTC